MFTKVKEIVTSDGAKEVARFALQMTAVVLVTAVVVNGTVATGSYIADAVTGKETGTTLQSMLVKKE